MTTTEYLIKRILNLESENERLRESVSSNRCVQDMINEVSDQIEIHKLGKDTIITLNIYKLHDKHLYDTCMKLFNLEWKEEIVHDSNKK